MGRRPLEEAGGSGKGAGRGAVEEAGGREEEAGGRGEAEGTRGEARLKIFLWIWKPRAHPCSHTTAPLSPVKK